MATHEALLEALGQIQSAHDVSTSSNVSDVALLLSSLQAAVGVMAAQILAVQGQIQALHATIPVRANQVQNQIDNMRDIIQH